MAEGTAEEIGDFTEHKELEVVQYFDDFTADTLDLCWQCSHVPDDSKWSLTERRSFLRLYTATVTKDFSKASNTLRQRVLGPQSSAEIKLDISHMADGDVAGLAVHQKEYTYIGVIYDAGSNQKYLILNDNGKEQIRTVIPAETTEIWFRANAVELEYRAEYFYSLDGQEFVRLGGRYDMHYGYYVGMGYGAFNFATKAPGGYVDLDSFAVNTYRRNSNYAAFGSKIEAENYDNLKYEVNSENEPSRDYNPLTTWTADYVYTNLLTKWGDAYDLAVSNLRDGDWMQYNRIDLGEGAAWFNVRVSGTADGGHFEVRLGAPDGRLLAVAEVPSTGDAEKFVNVFSEMDETVTGIQKLFLVYRGLDTACRINWFMFGVGAEPTAPGIPEVNVRLVGDGQAEISWEAVSGALEYDIRISEGGNEKVISNAVSPFVETEQESPCVISVRAKNYGGYSEWSEKVWIPNGM